MKHEFVSSAASISPRSGMMQHHRAVLFFRWFEPKSKGKFVSASEMSAMFTVQFIVATEQQCISRVPGNDLGTIHEFCFIRTGDTVEGDSLAGLLKRVVRDWLG